MSVEEQISHSDTVFAGRVLEVEASKEGYTNTKAVRFEVSEIWKGAEESQIIIFTGSGGGDCGISFTEGTEYLVYAQNSTMYGDKELLVTIMCDRTRPLIQAKEDLMILGEGKEPANIVNLEDDFNNRTENKRSEEVKKQTQPNEGEVGKVLQDKNTSKEFFIGLAAAVVVLFGIVIYFVRSKTRK
ncbi:hypothetical protein [Paenibacillus luteus]|uniref:hypothetical protein n=1 Tax=Paenibacillus luteus TaxID=2545753 RepID=UPI0019D62BC9|nr:hypothetical protein [Paenibacillus luteus]